MQWDIVDVLQGMLRMAAKKDPSGSMLEKI